MAIETFTLNVSGLEVRVTRKDIKNLHLAVYPPDGQVRVSAPRSMSEDALRLAVVVRLGWIHRQQAKFATQERQSEREMVGGESHYIWGVRYRLQVEEADLPPHIQIGGGKLLLRVRPDTPPEKRLAIFNAWYRAELKARIPALLEKWLPVIGVELSAWGVKRMKTRWGTCNTAQKRIWLNLELAKKPPQCLEYVLVHELVHLLERHHNDRFRELMDGFLPLWRQFREDLNRYPLAHEEWRY
ncbi:MAG: SprT family zinc-dependent metalloprotease [Anaerolineales bacterium]